MSVSTRASQRAKAAPIAGSAGIAAAQGSNAAPGGVQGQREGHSEQPPLGGEGAAVANGGAAPQAAGGVAAQARSLNGHQQPLPEAAAQADHAAVQAGARHRRRDSEGSVSSVASDEPPAAKKHAAGDAQRPVAAGTDKRAKGNREQTEQSNRFASKTPQASDLQQYSGEAEAGKLEAWLQQLLGTQELFSLNDVETITYASSRLVGTARTWWAKLPVATKQAIKSQGTDALESALRERFQPASTEREARRALIALKQGSTHINLYIAEFERLQALIPSLGAADAQFIFEEGLRNDLQLEVRRQAPSTLAETIKLVARVGAIGASSRTHPDRANQIEAADGDSTPRGQRLNEMYAMLSQLTQPQSGMGAKTQRGYEEQRGENNSRGRGRGGYRGGRGGSRQPREPPPVPGVPEALVRKRMEKGVCVRCGKEGHRAVSCPNMPNAQPLNE